MLMYTGLLSFKEVEIAVSIISCASSKLFTTAYSIPQAMSISNLPKQNKPSTRKPLKYSFIFFFFFFFLKKKKKKKKNNYIIAIDRSKAPELMAEVRQTNGVVKNSVCPVVIGVGTTDYANERQVLAVRPGDRVEDAETANGEGHDARADAAGAGVAVSGVPGVELVAAANVVEARLGDEMVEECQVEVAGDGKHVRHADLDKPARQVAAQGGLCGVHEGGGDRALDGRYGAVCG